MHWDVLGCTGMYWDTRGSPRPCPTPSPPPQKGPHRERAPPPRPRPDRSRPPLPPPPVHREDSDVGDVVRELLLRVRGASPFCLQRVPFTVSHVRDLLLLSAQWRFLLRDEGTPDPDGEDEEPEPCTGDSWAGGAVPVLSTRGCPGEVRGALPHGEVRGGLCPTALPGGAALHPPSAPPAHPRSPPPQVSSPCPPSPAGQQDPDSVPDAGSSPMEPPFPGAASGGSDASPGPGPEPPIPEPPIPEPLIPEPPQDGAAAAPRILKGNPARARAPVPRAAPLRPARLPEPPEPTEPPGPDRTPLPSYGAEDGSPPLSRLRPRLPPLSCSSIFSSWSGRASLSTVPKWSGSGSGSGSRSVLPVPGPCPGRRPERWIRPHVEVLEPVTVRHSRGPEPSGSRRPRGPLPAPVEPRPPPGAAPRPLGSLLDPARLEPGVSVRWGGSVWSGGQEQGQEQGMGQEEGMGQELGQGMGQLISVCPRAPSAVIAARRVTGEQ
uniref:Uncharacterized protein n=1 Tax=Melopsittacus undulatus TaxID=13146 RepID=A0A8V5FXB4_MELUD